MASERVFEAASVELDGATMLLVTRIREMRERIVQYRLRGTIARYPEIGDVEIRRLSDEQVIRLALAREYAHQEQVEKDMAK